MNIELEKLIDLAIADGVLSDKEKQVLIRKAEEAGVAWDEVEMILEAKLHQRQQAKAKFEDVVKKCPSCKEPIPALSKVCPACGYVVNTEASTSNNNKSLETLIDSIEDSIVEIKSFPKPSVVSPLKKQLPLILIAIAAILFVTATKIGTSDLGYLLMFGGGACAFGTIFIFINKYNNKELKEKRDRKDRAQGIIIAEIKEKSFEQLKADFEKHSRTAKTFFGENKKVSILIDEFKTEIQGIEQQRKKLMSQNWIVYAILIIIVIVVLLIPKPKKEWEITEETNAINMNLDKVILTKFDKLIENKNIDEATLLIDSLKLDDNILQCKSKIQWNKLIVGLDAIKQLIEEKQFKQAKLELQKVSWTRIKTEGMGNYISSIEYSSYKLFRNYQSALNDMLPKNYKIKIEKELEEL